MPNSSDRLIREAIFAARTRLFVGTQPQCKQSPPRDSFSTKATFAPNWAAPLAVTRPATPPPIITMSNRFMLFLSFDFPVKGGEKRNGDQQDRSHGQIQVGLAACFRNACQKRIRKVGVNKGCGEHPEERAEKLVPVADAGKAGAEVEAVKGDERD